MAQRNKRYVVTLGDNPGEQLVDDSKFTGYTNTDGVEYWQSTVLDQAEMLRLVQEITSTIEEPTFYIETVQNYRDIIIIDTSNADGDRALVLGALDDLFGRVENDIEFSEPFRIPTSKATFITWKAEA